MSEQTPSLAGRAVLALLLMIGFYALAVALAAVLVAIPYWEYQSLHRVHIKIALACGIGAVLIVWSVLPRWDKFPPPGVLLTQKTQPDLFAAIAAIAAATGQAMPVEVYLVPDVNAFVAQRGGVMGFFSRRVLGLGLPLLRVFDVDQIRAVIAHEFGHFHGGDTRLGPWVHKTRSAIVRTVQTLANAQSWLTYPFQWYGNMFLRITFKISRAQEYAADRLAAHVVGAAPLASGLKLLPAAATLYGTYLDQEVGPVLSAGRRPPLSAGFQLFLRSRDMEKAAAEISAQAMQADEENAFDTHPPTPRRVAALANLPAGGDEAPDHRPAIELLRDREGLERALLVFMTGKRKVAELPLIEWHNVGEEVLVPQWRDLVTKWSGLPAKPLATIIVAGLPAHVARAREIGKACVSREVPTDQHADAGRFVLAAALGAALHVAGFTADAQPGDPVALERDGHRFVPQDDVRQLAEGTLSAEAWRSRCAAAGVADLRLDTVGEQVKAST